MTPDNRIPELDAARGACILGMVAVHLIYDLTELYPLLDWEYPIAFRLLKNWGNLAFFLISGISVTLGHHPLRRGAVVCGCAVAVSAAMELAGAMPIRFGVLHCLGMCMLCWTLFRRLGDRFLPVVSALFIAPGLCFRDLTVAVPFLYPLGLTAPGFESADFFPLFPYFGYFLAGAAVGKRLYPRKRSLFPHLPPLRFLRFCGRHSLVIYLIHQPVLILLIEATVSTGGTFHEAFR